MRKSTDAKEKAFRDAIWTRDGGVCRATRLPLDRHSENLDRLGDCAHLLPRSTHPELKYDTRNALLLSRQNHIRSDARGGYILKLTDPDTGAPAVDASRPIRFTAYTKAGHVLWTRVS